MRQCRSISILLLFILINFCATQITTTKFQSSDIEIIPELVVINSTSITDFTCINHQPNELPLEVNLTKIISSDQIKLSTNRLNKSAIHIQLESNNYVGIFHLLCFSKGEQSKGTRADVIVKAAPGTLILVEKCRVYDREYIKCIIQAPVIARAIHNGYSPTFEFNEISHSPDNLAYMKRVEFLQNESTSEYLIFKWKPFIDGEFPNGVRMHMKAILPHFENASYYFDMTPVFRIKPKFILQAISSSEIQINLTPSSPPAFCEKSIMRNLTSNLHQTWTIIESDRNTILVDKLSSNSIYRVCIKCRQVFTDPDGTEECQEIKTLSKLTVLFNQKFFITIIYILIGILIIGLFVGIYFWRKQRNIVYGPISTKSEPDQNGTHENRYVSVPIHDTISNISENDNPRASTPFMDRNPHQEDSITDNAGNYLPIAPILEYMDRCSPPQILSPFGN